MNGAETDASAWTIARLLSWTREYLKRSGIQSPRLCAELLLAHALGCQRIELYTRFEQAPGPEVLNEFRELVRKAATGYPIAYLTGTKEFFSLTFEVGPDVLIPRPETETLVERTIHLARQLAADQCAVLDLGTGSGCIIVSLARHLPQARLFASDVSEAALAVARRNAERHAVADRIEFRAGNLFEPWEQARSAGGPDAFDILVCNPPYVSTADPLVERTVRDFEPRLALFAGPDGLNLIRPILAQAPTWIRPGGHLLMEIGYDQADRVRPLLAEPDWQDMVTYRDGAGYERVIHVRRSDRKR